MAWEAIARIAFKQDGTDRRLARAAYAALGGTDELSNWLPQMFAQFAALASGLTTPALLLAELPSISPGYTPTGNCVDDATEAARALGGATVPPEEALIAFRAWAVTNAAGGGVTLPAYGGTAATDDIGDLLAWAALAS